MVVISKHVLKRSAKQLEKVAKRIFLRLLSFFVKCREDISVNDLRDISKIIVIRPNFRIGNAILSTAIIEPLQRRFPGASIDFVVTDKTTAIFDNLPINQLITIPRKVMRRPWLAIPILRSLRSQHYDLAVQFAPGSLSGVLISQLAGARYVAGQPIEHLDCYDIKVKDPIVHAYDAGAAFSNAFGVTDAGFPGLALSNNEIADAQSQLQTLGQRAHDNFVAVFVGGHADKVCPVSFWLELIKAINATGTRFVVFVGPEEKEMVPQLQKELQACPYGVLCPPQPIRLFMGMLAQARLMITPDSGPMHMATALGVPITVMVQTRKSLAFIPPGPSSQVVFDLDISAVTTALVRLNEFDDARKSA